MNEIHDKWFESSTYGPHNIFFTWILELLKTQVVARILKWSIFVIYKFSKILTCSNFSKNIRRKNLSEGIPKKKK